MEVYQLRTFLAVAREGSITRASELLFLSQPAVSAHIKALEDEIGIVLFDRTPRGMSLTIDGASLLVKAEQVVAMHRDFIDEAKRIKGQLRGKLRLGSIRNPSAPMLGSLLAGLSRACPEVEVVLEHASSIDIVRAIRSGGLDAGFYAETGTPDAELETIRAGGWAVFLAAPPTWVVDAAEPDWRALARMAWICPQSDTCCGRVAEELFERHGFRPDKMTNVDQESVTRTLIAGGVGIGLLHAEAAREASAKGEVQLIGEPLRHVDLLFAFLRGRGHDPLVGAAATVVRGIMAGRRLDPPGGP